MSRSDKEKEALIYFPLDTDFFDDPKILLTEEEFGEIGGYFAVKLLSWIYKRGYFIEYKDNLCPSFARIAGRNFTSKLVKDVIYFLCSVEFFDSEILRTHNILTSRGIQKRYSHIQKLLRRNSNIKKEHLLYFPEEKKENVQKGVDSVQKGVDSVQFEQNPPQKEPQNNISLLSINKGLSNNTNPNNTKEEKEENSVQNSDQIAQNSVDSVQNSDQIAQNSVDSVQNSDQIAQNSVDSVQNSDQIAQRPRFKSMADAPTFLKYPWATEEFFFKWEDWKDYKYEAFGFLYLTAKSENSALSQLAKESKHDVAIAIDMIDYAIGRQWQGIFSKDKNEKNEPVNNPNGLTTTPLATPERLSKYDNYRK